MRLAPPIKLALTKGLRSAIYGRDRGSALVEFALSISVLIITLIGVTEVTQLVRADMKLRHTTEAFAKMASQQTAVSSGIVGNLCTGAAAMMAPFSPSDFAGNVTSFSNVGGKITQDWSLSGCAGGGAEAPNAQAAAQPLLPNVGDSMLVAYGTYEYTPIFHFILRTSVTLSHTVTFRPRTQTTIPSS